LGEILEVLFLDFRKTEEVEILAGKKKENKDWQNGGVN